MRNTFADTLYEGAKSDPRLCVVVADISPAGSMEKLREEYPKRFVNTGVAEQIMIGMCAGMAMRGLKPFAYTIATFALFRPYEFVRDDLCYQDLPVTVVGIGGGVTYSQLGGTHHAMEDVSLACGLPNMRVLAPCDPQETREATKWCMDQAGGPRYLRLGKAGEKTLTSEAEPWEFGKVRLLKYGMNACVLGYGPILQLAMDIPRVAVYSLHTLKPLDRDGIASIIRRYARVLVLEESVPFLAQAVKAIAFDIGAKCEIVTLSLRDEFLHVYGSHAEVLKAHGITSEAIREKLNA